jgi:hypothetical protein
MSESARFAQRNAGRTIKKVRLANDRPRKCVTRGQTLMLRMSEPYLRSIS